MSPNMHGFIRKGSLLSALIAAMFAPQAYAIPAGRVDFAVGKVSATAPDGTSRDLVKGAEVNPGDSIATGGGRVQIRFTDGAYMSLQPNTVFKVENYTFNGKADGEERGIFSLVTGGLRTISGMIGKGKRENYEVRTKTATIGIRGTAYSASQIEDTLTVTVGEGSIAVTNQGGSLTIGSGQSAVVRSPQVPPEMSNEKALAPKSEAQQEETKPAEQQATASGEQRTVEGQSTPVAELIKAVTPVPTPTPTPAPPAVLASGSGFTLVHVPSNGDFFGMTPGVTTGGSAIFDAGGTLKSFAAGGSTLDFATAGTAMETGSDALIGWGRWIGQIGGTMPGSNPGTPYSGAEGIHYVTGIPSSLAALTNLGTAVVDYAMFGHTQPSTWIGGSATAGSVGGATPKVTVTFGGANPTMVMGFDVNTNTTPGTYTMSTFGTITLSVSDPATFVGSSSSSSGTCVSACSLSLSGLFTGATAERVGIVYRIHNPNNSSETKGAAVFKAP